MPHLEQVPAAVLSDDGVFCLSSWLVSQETEAATKHPCLTAATPMPLL